MSRVKAAFAAMLMSFVMVILTVTSGTNAQTREEDRWRRNSEDAQHNIENYQSFISNQIAATNSRVNEANKRIDDTNALALKTDKEVEEGRKVFQALGTAYRFLIWFIPALFSAFIAVLVAAYQWIWPAFMRTACGRKLRYRYFMWRKSLKKLARDICASPTQIEKLHDCFGQIRNEQAEWRLQVDARFNLQRDNVRHDIRDLLTPITMQVEQIQNDVGLIEGRMAVIERDRLEAIQVALEEAKLSGPLEIDTNETAHRIENKL